MLWVGLRFIVWSYFLSEHCFLVYRDVNKLLPQAPAATASQAHDRLCILQTMGQKRPFFLKIASCQEFDHR